mmetsp:Transcript_56471/g.137049  ORF Transcript_56471/g.137049 Transcript_56471/m.137049 type:complete len:919 (-) Transcript_56471:2895-5651(-)
MSGWLNQVGTLLEKLDDKAEAVAEEQRAIAQEEEDEADGGGLGLGLGLGSSSKGGGSGGGTSSSLGADEALGEILAKRGLALDDPHDDDDDEDEEDDVVLDNTDQQEDGQEQTEQQLKQEEEGGGGNPQSTTNQGPNVANESSTEEPASDSALPGPKNEDENPESKDRTVEQDDGKKQAGEHGGEASSASVSSSTSASGLNNARQLDQDGAGKGPSLSSSSSAKQISNSSKPTKKTLAPFSLQLSPPPKPLSNPSNKEDESKEAEEASAEKEKESSPSKQPSQSASSSAGTVDKPSTSTSSSLPSLLSNLASKATPTKSKPTGAAGAQQTSSSNTPTRPTQRERELLTEMRDAQKESRTLRRHVVALNEQLEAAEAEMQAQRKELDRAAERMEKDRKRSKDDKEKAKKQQTEELALLKAQHEKNLKEQKDRMEEQLDAYRKRLADEEKIRKQEGGDWNKEMSDAIEREQQMRQTVSVLEDEKSVLLAQISTLQGQQTALGSRLESLTQANENAMIRERDAEDRLDSALNQHARQISQRQAREAELERTVQELNAALVSRGSSGSLASTGRNGVGGGDGVSDARIATLQSDLEIAHSQLGMERERSETLQMQLRDLSKETTQEATEIHAKQIQYDRQIAELNLTISKLQAKLQEAEKSRLMLSERSNSNNSDDPDHEKELSNRVKVLSEEVVRLRDKVANYSSESLAMKHRLKAATDRANKAEDDLAVARTSAPRSVDFDIETGGGTLSKRRRGVGSQTSSIKSALRLEGGLDPRTQQIGEVVDAVDSFAVSTGKYLRKNPLARAGFIFYLLLIHTWTFVLLFFHAHNFEVEHGDFGAGVGLPHGPHALMQQKQPVLLSNSVNGDASAAKPNNDNPAKGTANENGRDEADAHDNVSINKLHSNNANPVQVTANENERDE